MPYLSATVWLLVGLVIVLAVTFDFINGFHDTANAIATVVATRVLRAGAAIVMAAVLNFLGALTGQAVAKTVTSGLVSASAVKGVSFNSAQVLVIAALIGAIVWNLITWYYGIPSSSSHALIGGVVGAGAMTFGTAAGGWCLMRTMGNRLVHLEPIHGFAAETTAATIIETASRLGFPLSTTHVISSCILGVGAARRLTGVRWAVALN